MSTKYTGTLHERGGSSSTVVWWTVIETLQATLAYKQIQVRCQVKGKGS